MKKILYIVSLRTWVQVLTHQVASSKVPTITIGKLLRYPNYLKKIKIKCQSLRSHRFILIIIIKSKGIVLIHYTFILCFIGAMSGNNPITNKKMFKDEEN